MAAASAVRASYDARMDVMQLIAAHDADATAVVHGSQERTWAQLRESIERVAGGIGARVRPGQVVVVVGDTSIEFVEVVLGALAAGATVLPLSPRDPHAELERACALASPDLVVSVEAGATADGLSAPVVPAGDLRNGDAGPPVEVDPDAPALLLFTSGTAGQPRVAMLSRNNIDASIRSTVQSSAELVDAAAVIAGVMPLTHVLGLVSVVGVSLALGSTLVLLADTEVHAVAQSVASRGVTLLVAPPVFWFRMVESGIEPSLLSTVRLAISGAAPLSGSLARRVEEGFGIVLRQGYGLTEASPGLTSAVGTAAPATSVGRPLPDVELRLVDEFGDEALLGDVGEVLARGPNVFLGYLDDAEATARVLDDGWLRTGDLAIVDDHGYLFLVGRSKDQIISAGFNVHPGEVEDRLVAHPSVVAAAVVGEPDREYGEVVIAFVVTTGETPAGEELRAHCRSVLAGYKVPRRIEFVDELPLGLGGKLRRHALRTR